jgi:hypothetical protein
MKYILTFSLFTILFSCKTDVKQEGVKEKDLKTEVKREIKKESTSIKVAYLKSLLSQADTLTSDQAQGIDQNFKINGQNLGINALIAQQLEDIMQQPDIANYDLDSLLRHEYLNITISEDKRLGIFSWYDNNGGTWSIYDNVIFYKTAANDFKTHKDLTLENNPNSYYPSSAKCKKIYKLKSTNNKDLYLCIWSSSGCSTCCAQIASVIEITDNSILFEYPAFTNSNLEKVSDITIDSRCGDIEKFEFNPSSEIISYRYLVDDNTPLNDSKYPVGKVISGKYKWNGVKFVEEVVK